MNLCIIQCRMGSTRLPGKALKTINGKSLLELMIQRIQPAETISELMVATTSLPEDDAIESICKKLSIRCFRGDSQNVLDRFYQAVASLHERPDYIIRVTADCPLHHHKVIDFCVEKCIKGKFDYFSNSNQEPVLEDGCDTEVFTYAALQTAWKNATKNSEKEHVTPYIKNSGTFRCEFEKFHSDYQFKLSVDNSNDLRVVNEIYHYFYPDEMFSIHELVACLATHPEILELNKSSRINEGYLKSLDDEKLN